MFSIVVHSFKGGPGKSTITANLATSLARVGYRVGVVDMDLAGPGLHVIFELKRRNSTRTLHDFLLSKCTASETVTDLTRKLGLEKGMLVFIPASHKAQDIIKVLQRGYELATFRRAMKEVFDQYSLDYLLIDTRPGIEETTLLAMTIGNVILLVSRLDNQDIFGTGVTLEVAKALRKPVYLILNMIPSRAPKKSRERLEGIFDVPIISEIPFYSDVLRSLSSGVFSLNNPAHDFSSKMRALAVEITKLTKEKKSVWLPPSE